MVDLPNFLARNHSNRPDPQPTLVMLEAFVANVIQSCQQKVETALRSRSVCLSRVTRRYSHFGAVCWLKGNSPPIESDPCQGCDDAPGLPSNATTCLEHRRARDALVIRSSWNPAIASPEVAPPQGGGLSAACPSVGQSSITLTTPATNG